MCPNCPNKIRQTPGLGLVLYANPLCVIFLLTGRLFGFSLGHVGTPQVSVGTGIGTPLGHPLGQAVGCVSFCLPLS
jgi:hypothetical protein